VGRARLQDTGYVNFIRRFFNRNNFVGSAALAEVCVLLSAVLVIMLYLIKRKDIKATDT